MSGQASYLAVAISCYLLVAMMVTSYGKGVDRALVDVWDWLTGGGR